MLISSLAEADAIAEGADERRQGHGEEQLGRQVAAEQQAEPARRPQPADGAHASAPRRRPSRATNRRNPRTAATTRSATATMTTTIDEISPALSTAPPRSRSSEAGVNSSRRHEQHDLHDEAAEPVDRAGGERRAGRHAVALEEADVDGDAGGRRRDRQVDVRHRQLQGVDRPERQRHRRGAERRDRLGEARDLGDERTPSDDQPPRRVAQLSTSSARSRPASAEISTNTASAGRTTRTIEPRVMRRSCWSSGGVDPDRRRRRGAQVVEVEVAVANAARVAGRSASAAGGTAASPPARRRRAPRAPRHGPSSPTSNVVVTSACTSSVRRWVSVAATVAPRKSTTPTRRHRRRGGAGRRAGRGRCRRVEAAEQLPQLARRAASAIGARRHSASGRAAPAQHEQGVVVGGRARR